MKSPKNCSISSPERIETNGPVDSSKSPVSLSQVDGDRYRDISYRFTYINFIDYLSRWLLFNIL